VPILAKPGVNMLWGPGHKHKSREEKGERVKRIHIRYKNKAVLHLKKFQKT
jgi:hypothetical protein